MDVGQVPTIPSVVEEVLIEQSDIDTSLLSVAEVVQRETVGICLSDNNRPGLHRLKGLQTIVAGVIVGTEVEASEVVEKREKREKEQEE
jgi:hypothetical protein